MVRRLGYIALAAVITQGILGGITVLWYLPDAIRSRTPVSRRSCSVSRDDRVVTSPGWQRAYGRADLKVGP